uniref:Guanylate cyclase domain-containing protein n=1 Tax=Tetradesmus obliquus TaxID=3088 RepID=A0A383WDG8_TETOB|eukprot:jgi/Sobl393_1/1886/SZX75300.1
MSSRNCCLLWLAALCLLFTVLSSNTVAAAPSALGATGGSSSSNSSSSSSRSPLPQSCPGVSDGVCGSSCQLYLCEALATFYKVTNNVSDPWDKEYGWQRVKSTPCSKLVTPVAAAGSPAYCRWWGITCCQAADVAKGDCSAVHGIKAIDLPINNLNASLSNPGMVSSLLSIHACGLTVLNLEANNLAGSIPEQYSQLVNLKVLNLAACWVSGTIPAALSKLRNLTYINLSNNWMNGPLPGWLHTLSKLQHINLGTQFGGNEGSEELLGLTGQLPQQLGQLKGLRQLNLEMNSLSGELPPTLCSDASELAVLNVRVNLLEGPASVVERCRKLMQLNLASNALTGPLPASRDWSELTTYSAANNGFSGSFPKALALYARNLEHLDISGNALTGQLPTVITLLSSLQSLDIADNQLSGTLSGDLYYLPALAQLDASNNNFVGTIPAAIGLSYSLEGVDLSNNTGLTGQLPPEIGLLARFNSFKGRNTSMSCAGIIRPYNVTTNSSCTDPRECTTPETIGNASDAGVLCAPEQLLPCFLRFSDWMVPRDDASNMRCKVILRREPDNAQEVCAATSAVGLGDQAGLLPAIWPDQAEQEWSIDPSYYQYQVCECLFGYEPRWDANRTTLTCVRSNDSSHNQLQAVILGTVFGVAFVLAGLFAWLVYLRTRPRWLRERQQQAKRLKGAPVASRLGDKASVSIVVTDVKDFTELTRKYPQLMSKAMGSHNSILRKACHSHAGYVLDQEGDSWCIAFHDALDAVAFSLQVQQAFAQLKAWGIRPGEQLPPELQQTDSTLFGRFWQRTNTSSSISSAPALHGSSTHSGSAAERSGRTASASKQQQQQQQLLQADDMAAADNLVRRSAASFTSGVGSGLMGGTSSFSSGRSGRAEALGLYPSVRLDSNVSVDDVERQQRTAHVGTHAAAAAAGASSRAAAAAAHDSSSRAADQDGVLQLPADVHRLRDDSASEQRQSQQQQLNHSDIPSSHSKDAAAAAAMQQQQQQHVGDTWQGPNHSSAAPCWVAAGQQQSHSAPLSRRSSSGVPSITHEGGGTGTMSTQVSMYSSMERQTSHEGSGMRLWSASGLALRFSRTLSRAAPAVGGSGRLTPPGHAAVLQGLQAPLQMVRVVVRIGVATGPLTAGSDVASCAVKDRAKELLSDVANGGQILLDEPTFSLVKDSLAVLGTVNDGGYDDALLQDLMRGQVVEKMKRQVACAALCVRPSPASFAGSFDFRDVSHDNDAMVAHMGAFEVPGFKGLTAEPAAAAAAAPAAGPAAASGLSPTASFSAKKQPRSPSAAAAAAAAAGPATAAAGGARHATVVVDKRRKSISADDKQSAATAAAAAAAAGAAVDKRRKSISASNKQAAAAAAAEAQPADGEPRKSSPRAAQQQQQHSLLPLRPRKKQKDESQLLHVYSIAAPGMRRAAESTQELAACAAWTAPINMKRGWRQKQKGFFDAPGAHQMDLSPTSSSSRELQQLPEVTIVFASVADADVFTARFSRPEVQEVCKTIRQVMLQQLEAISGRDGYLCRCRDSDTKYIAAFTQPHLAVQWCLLVQEALLYADWPAAALSFPGFSEVLDPASGLLLFRGPRLRMGLAAGRPDRILPDHTGRASYYGHSVNCAARYMDAAAHGGQIVTDLALAQKLFAAWASVDSGAEASMPAPAPDNSDKLWDAEQQGLQLTENLLRHHEQTLQQHQPALRSAAAGSSVRSSSIGAAAPAAQQQQQQLRPGGGRWAAFAGRRLPAAAAAADEFGADTADLLVVGRSRSETAARYLSSNSSSSGAMHAYGLGGWRAGLPGLGHGLPPLPLHEEATSGPLDAVAADDVQGSGSAHPAAAAAAAAVQRGAGANCAVELTPRAHSFSTSPLVPCSRPGVPDASLLVLPQPLPAATATAAPAAAAAADAPPTSEAAAAAAAGDAAEQLPAQREAVWAVHLGSFSFKGSGTFDMVQIISDSLSGRAFPLEAPRGKGARLVAASGRVESLPEVQLTVPGKLVATWQAAIMRQAAAAAAAAGAGAAAAEDAGLLQREQSLQSNAPLQREASLQGAAGQRPAG